MTTPIKVGIVGTGFIARTRARCYQKIAGVNARLAAVASGNRDNAKAFASQFSVATVHNDYTAMLNDDSVDVVDLCVPNHLHQSMAIEAAKAGKHIICTKPLTAYVGKDLDLNTQAIADVPMRKRLALAVAEADAMLEAAKANEVKLMYAENWVYAPAVVRAATLLGESQGSIMEMRGWESHSGSHSEFSKQWRYTGGGALLRLGAHPIAAMLHLKKQEGLRKNGDAIYPISVIGETRDLSAIAGLDKETSHVAVAWEDVENWGAVIINFSDGSVGTAYGSDVMLGGMESKLEILSSNSHLKCNLSPNDMLKTYAPSDAVFANANLMEKVSGTSGWNSAIPDEDWCSGHVHMIENFMQDIAHNRSSQADGELGALTTRVVYAAYVSADEGCRIQLSTI